MEHIEDVSFDVDAVDGPHGESITQATLILEGDFVDACEKYLAITDPQHKDFGKLYLGIGRSTAEKLVSEVGAYLS